MAMSSFLILPANRSASKNSFSSFSGLARKSSGVFESSFSRLCKYHEAAASDIKNKTSPFSQLPESITTDRMLLSCKQEFEATNTGAVLKLSERESGKAFSNAPPRLCIRQVSPRAIACHDGASDLRSNSIPAKAANEPIRAFSSEYHDRVRPAHES